MNLKKWFKSVVLMMEFEFRSFEFSTIMLLFIIEPLAQVLIFGIGLSSNSFIMKNNGNSYLLFIFSGILGLLGMKLFNRNIFRFTNERRWGIQAFKLLSGIKPSAYIIGVAIVNLFIFLLQSCFAYVSLLILGYDIIILERFIIAIICGFSVVLFWTTIPIFITYFVKNYKIRDMVVSFSLLPITLTAPAFYDLTNAPKYLKIISSINPLNYQITLIRGVMSYGEINLLPFIISVFLACFALLSAYYCLTIGEKMSKEGR